MTNDRYTALTKEEAELTPEEIKAGWHFCYEFDGLLVGPGMSELEYCRCFNGGEGLFGDEWKPWDI